MVARLLTTSPALLMIYSGLCYAIVHSTVKALERLSTQEIVFFRAIISLVITYYFLKKMRIPVWGHNKALLYARGFFGTAALLTYFYTLKSMPLATAITVQYLHPIITIVLAGLVFKEWPLRSQWFLFVLAFSGVIIAKGFDARVSTLDLGIGILSAFFSAVAYSLIRKIGKDEHPLVTVFYFPLIAMILVGPWVLTNWMTPTPYEFFLLGIVGVFTQLAQYTMTIAYTKARAADISYITYLGIPYGLIIGYIWFDETLGSMSLLGIFVVVASVCLSHMVSRRARQRSDI